VKIAHQSDARLEVLIRQIQFFRLAIALPLGGILMAGAGFLNGDVPAAVNLAIVTAGLALGALFAGYEKHDVFVFDAPIRRAAKRPLRDRRNPPDGPCAEADVRLGDPPRAPRRARQGDQVEVVDVPVLDSHEVLVLVMAAGVNYNGVWAGLGVPISMFDVHKARTTISPAPTRRASSGRWATRSRTGRWATRS
jgi:hypothetical protein